MMASNNFSRFRAGLRLSASAAPGNDSNSLSSAKSTASRVAGAVKACSFSSLTASAFVALETGSTLDLGNDWPQRAVLEMRRTEIAQTGVGLLFQPLQHRRGHARLADPWLAGQQNDLTFAGFRPRPAAHQELEFLLAANQRQRRRSATLRSG